MKGRWKKAFTLIGTTAILTATALSMAACSSAPDDALPEGWEVVSTDGNVEYLTLTEGSGNMRKLTHDEELQEEEREHFPTFTSHGLGTPEGVEAYDGSDLYVYGLSDHDYYACSDGEDLKLIYYFGGIPTDYTVETEYQVEVRFNDSLGFGYSSVMYTFDLDKSDIFDVRRDESGNLYAQNAVRITIPASDLQDKKDGTISVWLTFEGEEGYTSYLSDGSPVIHDDTTILEQGQRFRFYRRDGQIWLSDPSLNVINHVRSQFPYAMYEAWEYILPGILILEIALFIFAMRRERYLSPFLAAPAGAAILGIAFSTVVMNYYDSLPTDRSDMFGGLAYMGEEIALLLWAAGFVIGTVILAIIFAILHHVRQKRMWKKAAAQSAEQTDEQSGGRVKRRRNP